MPGLSSLSDGQPAPPEVFLSVWRRARRGQLAAAWSSASGASGATGRAWSASAAARRWPPTPAPRSSSCPPLALASPAPRRQLDSLLGEARAALDRLGYGMLGLGRPPDAACRARRLLPLPHAAAELRLRHRRAALEPLVDRERGLGAGDRRRLLRRCAARRARAAPARRADELRAPQRPRPSGRLRGLHLGAAARLARPRAARRPVSRATRARSACRRARSRAGGTTSRCCGSGPMFLVGQQGQGRRLRARAPDLPALPARRAERRLARADAVGRAAAHRPRASTRREDRLDLHGLRAHPLEVARRLGRAGGAGSRPGATGRSSASCARTSRRS